MIETIVGQIYLGCTFGFWFSQAAAREIWWRYFKVALILKGTAATATFPPCYFYICNNHFTLVVVI